MEIGDVFLPSDPRIDSHPRVVISDPEIAPVVLVNFTGAEGEYRDHSCLLEVGEYPWLTKQTCISYKDATFVSPAQLELLESSGMFRKLAPVSDAVLKKILEGAELTDELPIKFIRALASQGLISS